MATGRSMQLTKMTAEYLACAELCRRGFLSTTFTGNVPMLDVLAADKDLETIPIQVKGSTTGNWQLNVRTFLNIGYDEKTEIQTIIKKWDFRNSKLIYIFIKVVGQGKDEFYIVRLKDVQRTILKHHVEYLRMHGGRRPKNPKSMHIAISLKHLSGYRDNWQVLQEEKSGRGRE